jgi:hypothetical protein
MNRLVEPEWLDALAPDDPRAIHSRHDLRRVNAWMGNAQIMAGALASHSARGPRQITDLGAGDGHFLLRVAEKLNWPDANATLLDLKNIVSAKTIADFTNLGWRAEAVIADVFAWRPASNSIAVANLFLHHFENDRLAVLLRNISERAGLFVAVEPRRSAFPFLASQLLWLIGCNATTRHDAATSISAGFTGDEISALWPDQTRWQLTERSAGPFSHLFVARRIS